MKRNLLRIAILVAVACNSGTASAQLSNLVGDITSVLKSSGTKGKTGDLLSTIGGVITSKLTPTSKQIAGTWVYQEPAVMFTSDNALRQTASSVVSKQIESKLQGSLSKVGVQAGKMNMVFEEDKTFYVQRNGKKIASGTYALSNNDVTLTFKGKSKPCSVTPQLDNGTLVVVTDATRLKDFLEGIGSKIPQLATVTSLMRTMNGMKVGIRMKKN